MVRMLHVSYMDIHVQTTQTTLHTCTHNHRHTPLHTRPPHAPRSSRVCVPAPGGAEEGEELRKGPTARNTELAVEAIRVNTVHTVCTYTYTYTMSIVIARAIGTYKYIRSTVHLSNAAWHMAYIHTYIGGMVGCVYELKQDHTKVYADPSPPLPSFLHQNTPSTYHWLDVAKVPVASAYARVKE